MSHVVVARSAEETRAVGARLARLLRPGDLLVLSGDLGAGKTTFTQGLAGGLGVRGGRLVLAGEDILDLRQTHDRVELPA